MAVAGGIAVRDRIIAVDRFLKDRERLFDASGYAPETVKFSEGSESLRNLGVDAANLIASCSDYFDRIGLALKQGLAIIENEIHGILKAQRARAAAGDENAVDATTLNVAAHRLENLVHDRRAAPAQKPFAAVA